MQWAPALAFDETDGSQPAPRVAGPRWRWGACAVGSRTAAPRLALVPNEKRFVRFDFSVEHPTGMIVTGLP